MENKLVIGMPAGSLANSQRGGNLAEFLENSGFAAKGYDAGGPTSFTTVNYLFGWDGRPQEFGTQLSLGELDVAIAGDDWIEERRLELEIEYNIKLNPKKILSLKRGNVKLVGIADNAVEEKTTEDFLKNFFQRDKKIITVVTELPYMALNWIQRKLNSINLGEFAKSWSVQKYKTPPKIEKGILIYETWGKTEAKIKNSGADIGLEITQSGSALKNYGLKIIDEVFTSEAGIWINPKVVENKEKKELVKMLVINFFGTINAENKVLMIFNVPEKNKNEIENYLCKYNLYADEPTVISGAKYAQYSIQIETDKPQMPISKVRYELITLGARSIDTMPLLSSIPDISSALDF